MSGDRLFLREFQGLIFSCMSRDILQSRSTQAVHSMTVGSSAPIVAWHQFLLSNRESYFTNTVANPNNIPMLTISVAVVRKILDAVAGSAP